jgi:hypothetical protein
MLRVSTHSQRIDRWLGNGEAQRISDGMKGWYGPPIPIFGVPGNVYATGGVYGGDFCGRINGGYFTDLADYATARFKRTFRNWSHEQTHTLNMGFSSLSDLISEATTGGKLQQLYFTKVGGAAVAAVGQSVDTWGAGTFPAAAANPASMPTGTSFTKSNTAALQFVNPGGSDTLHVTTITASANATGTMMLYDRLWAGNNSLNATSNTGLNLGLTRYANSTSNSAGNFVTPVVVSGANATATNLTVNYSNQAGSANANTTAIAFRVSAANLNIGLAAGQWFIPLNAGDTGLSNMSAVYSSGAQAAICAWTVGHPIAFVPFPVANIPFILDGINSAFNLTQVWTDAALAFMSWCQAATTQIAFQGQIQLVSG